MRLRTMEIMGKKVDVDVDEAGYFGATVGGVRVRANALAELERRACVALRKVQARVAVQFVHVHRGQYEFKSVIRAGVAVGLHATTDRALVRWEGGKTVQLAGYELGRCLRPLAALELAVLRRLTDAKDKADAAFDDFVTAHQLNVDLTLRKLVAAETERLAVADAPAQVAP